MLHDLPDVQVWISFAGFENSVEDGKTQLEKTLNARMLFDRAYQYLKGQDLKAERVVLLEAWKSMEVRL